MDRSHRHSVGICAPGVHPGRLLGIAGFWPVECARLAGSRGAGPAKRLAPPAPSQPKSVILVFLTGGPEPSRFVRHEARTRRSGFAASSSRPRRPSRAFSFASICRGSPARADRLAIVRSLSHSYTNHLNATHEILTGHSQPGAFFDKIASRDDYPCYASAVDAIRPRSDGVPSGVSLPTFLMEGPLTWPGQHAGFLGPKHDPWQVRQDPNRPGFGFEGLTLPAGLSVERLDRRKSLLDELGDMHDQVAARACGVERPVRGPGRASLHAAALGQGCPGV